MSTIIANIKKIVGIKGVRGELIRSSKLPRPNGQLSAIPTSNRRRSTGLIIISVPRLYNSSRKEEDVWGCRDSVALGYLNDAREVIGRTRYLVVAGISNIVEHMHT